MTRRRVECVGSLVGGVVSAHRIGGAQPGSVEGVVEHAAENFGCPECDQTTKCPFGVGRCRVEQDPCHGSTRFARLSAVDALADRRRRIAAFESELVDERVR